jgi:hypothetical protein
VRKVEDIIHNGKNIGKLFCSNYDYKAIEQLRLLSERPGFRYMYASPICMPEKYR